jgi:hypothetical protein
VPVGEFRSRPRAVIAPGNQESGGYEHVNRHVLAKPALHSLPSLKRPGYPAWKRTTPSGSGGIQAWFLARHGIVGLSAEAVNRHGLPCDKVGTPQGVSPPTGR